MPIPGHSFIEVRVDVVAYNIPMLLGLDALDKFGIYVNNVKDVLVHDRAGWTIPLTRKARHV